MISHGLLARVVALDDDRVITEQSLDDTDLATAAGERAAELGRGIDHALEMADPDGVLWPVGEWFRVAVVIDGVAVWVAEGFGL